MWKVSYQYRYTAGSKRVGTVVRNFSGGLRLLTFISCGKRLVTEMDNIHIHEKSFLTFRPFLFFQKVLITRKKRLFLAAKEFFVFYRIRKFERKQGLSENHPRQGYSDIRQ